MMKNFVLLHIFFATILTENIVNGVKVAGPGTDFKKILEKIWLKGTGEMVNKLPDVTFNDNIRERWPGNDASVGRRLLQEAIATFIKKRENEEVTTVDDEGKPFVDNDFTDYDHDPAFVKKDAVKDSDVPNWLKKVGIQILRSINRRTKPQKQKEDQHDRKVKEILNFMQDHRMSTNYFYDEMKRILKGDKPMNDLRYMVEYLERPGMEKLKESVMNCFKEKRLVDSPPVDAWKKYVPNNLVINTYKDPYNYGFIN